MIFVIAVAVIVLSIFIGILLAGATYRLDKSVAEVREAVENEDREYNPSLTFGHQIKLDADLETQMRQARTLAARRAAQLPRGANMRIGRLGHENLHTAHDGLEDDPLTAVRIAAYHGWDGAKMGAPAGEMPAAAQAATTQQVAPAKKPEDLVPGEDYPYTEITDDMSPDEVRKARIANAKARSAAVKALKQAEPAAAPAATPAQARAPQTAEAAPAVTVPDHIEEPDYIEITDEMEADEVRKARIQNAKARSRYNKALKEAGIDPKAVEAGETTATPATAPAPAQTAPAPQQAQTAEAPAVTVPDRIEEPDYIEITDDMEADEVRKARVHNAKERSRYNKALKEAGLDPKAVAAQKEAAAVQKEATPTSDSGAAATASGQSAETEAASAPAQASVTVPDHIEEPDYIEITDDMDADEVRKARIHNARERSRFNKALKEAGIDPKAVQT